MEDTFPLFFLRILYHLLCFSWRAPAILWIIPYIEYFALVARLLPANSLTKAASWSGISLHTHLLLPRKYISAQDRALFGDGLRRLLFIAVSPEQITGLLQLLQTLTGLLVPRLKATKELKSIFSRLNGLLLLLLRSADPETQTGFQKSVAANKASRTFSATKTALQTRQGVSKYPLQNNNFYTSTLKSPKTLLPNPTSVTFTEKQSCNRARQKKRLTQSERCKSSTKMTHEFKPLKHKLFFEIEEAYESISNEANITY